MVTFVNPQSLQVILAGPGTSNRLFIFTGIAEIDYSAGDDDVLRNEMVSLNLSVQHGGIRFNPKATQLAGVAWPSSMHATDDAEDVTWAVDQTSSEISSQGELLMKVLVALQGNNGALSRIAYELFVQTTSLRILRVSIAPNDITLGNQPVAFGLSVLLADPALAGGELVSLSSDSPGVSIPSSITVAENQTFAATTGQVIPSPAFPPGSTKTVNITAATAVSQLTNDLVVHA